MRKWLLLLLLLPQALHAQSVRGSLTNLGRYIEVRPIQRDTVDSLLTNIRQDGRLEFDGRVVFCNVGVCTFYRPADVEHALTSAHDLALTAWGLGVQGLSATAMLRVRTDGGDFTWPRSDDAFDAILAYADYTQERYRIRLGRQRALSGLGFYTFDGIDARYDLTGDINVAGYFGRSLARALEEPRNNALSAVESFVPSDNVWLIGGAAELSYARNSAAIRYQREILGDRSGLVSERASVDFTSSQLDRVYFEGSADYDVAFGHFGKAHITARVPIGSVAVELSGRRYMPFFELWTIWGAFSPVAYHEAEVQAGWNTYDWLTLSARAAWRKYEDADAPVFIAEPRNDGRLFALRARVVRGDAHVEGEARVENGFGAYLGSGEITAGWQVSSRWRVAGYATAFQQILEFRTGEAAVTGVGASTDYQISDDIFAGAGATFYFQRYDNRPSAADWTQKRAWLSLEWRFGNDPGLTAKGEKK